MKHTTTLAAFMLLAVTLNAQMRVKKHNTTTFRKEEKAAPAILNSHSSVKAQSHPEYGVLPYNAQCKECVELIDKRTVDSRFFMDPMNVGHTYSQKSYLPLHYKRDSADVWRTIDPRLKPVGNGVYVADRQPVISKLNLAAKSTSLIVDGQAIEFNKGLTMYFFDDNSMYTRRQPANYSNHTVGEEGLTVKDVWPGIEMEQLFTEGQIKTNYIIAAPLQLPVSHGWMVIEDHLTLPVGYTIHEEQPTYHTAEGYYRGNYEIRNATGEKVFAYDKPVYLDANVLGMPGVYNLLQTGNDYTLQMLIPVEWLAKPDNRYPLLIDPVVLGRTKIGDYVQTGLPSASMGFTSMALGSCDYSMIVTVPGNSEVTNAFVEMEYSLTYDNTCGAPPLPPPFCTFSQVNMEVMSNDCNTTTGALSCSPSQPPFTGTCTTDSNLVPGANAILINSFVPNYLSCIQPQCPDYHLSFTLKNRDSICGDHCGYLCARGNMWRMTVEAVTVKDATITIDKRLGCPGENFTVTGTASGGVPPYCFVYTTDGGVTSDTTCNASWVINPQNNVTISCYVLDGCGNGAVTNDTSIVIYPRPVITLVDSVLSVSANLQGIQWYLNGDPIGGANSSTYTPTQPGQYTVTATDGFSCTSTSDIYYYLVSGIGNIADGGKLAIIPNPSDGNFTIRCDAVNAADRVELRITDVSGKLVDTRNNIQFTGGHTYIYRPDVKLVNGSYYVEIASGGKIYRERMMVVK